MVKIETTPISNLAVGNKNIDLLNIGNDVVMPAILILVLVRMI